jgi:high-affinity Fe2+/Pb2+ permease
VGGFLSGLMGYKARPTIYETVAYVGYLVAAGLLVFGPLLRPSSGPAGAQTRVARTAR